MNENRHKCVWKTTLQVTPVIWYENKYTLSRP